jgi:serine protease Do
VSPDGIIVTNNHVVAGAGLIKVHLDGVTEPFNARLVGASECADLAVIDIDVDDAAFLGWAEDAVSVGQDILVAGFPLGDPEYTLIDGIISKEHAFGDTNWASIESVIEHTGDTLPGSSGGPILDPDGAVIAVNYAGDDLGQAFGISAETARAVTDAIVAGEDTLSIGVNGWAYEDDYDTGIWVASVVPDSQADRVGIRSGDLITNLGGLIIGEDGTLAAYCDILDSHLPDRPFDVAVWRDRDGTYLEGVFNSDQALVAVEVDSEVEAHLDQAGLARLPAGTAYTRFEAVYDSESLVTIQVPIEWDDREAGPWEEYDRIVGSSIIASSDLAGWRSEWGVPGVFVGVSSELAADGVLPADYLGELELADCTLAEELHYDDGLYVGEFNVWSDCGGTATMFIDWAALDASASYLISAQFTVASEADIDAVVHALDSLYLTADLVD